jgi:Flp pilus assembly protein TadG
MKRDMKSIFHRLRGDRSGVVAILAALSMVSIVGFTGLAVDVGNVYYAQAKLQAAADAAALAGATATSYSAVSGKKNGALSTIARSRARRR